MNPKDFHAYTVALALARSVREPIRRIAMADSDLARQMRRATHSSVLNLSEGNRRVGKDRLHLFRVAAGSVAEIQASLDVADALGYTTGDTKEPKELTDRLLAMLHRLTSRKK